MSVYVSCNPSNGAKKRVPVSIQPVFGYSHSCAGNVNCICVANNPVAAVEKTIHLPLKHLLVTKNGCSVASQSFFGNIKWICVGTTGIYWQQKINYANNTHFLGNKAGALVAIQAMRGGKKCISIASETVFGYRQ